MQDITIRRLEAGDIGPLEGMITDLAAHHGDMAMADEVTLKRDCLGNDPWLHVWVAERSGEMVGYMACQRRVQLQSGKRGCDLHHLFVAPAARGEGIGRALVRAARQWAEDETCAVVMVGTDPENIRAQAFYLGLGFQQVAIDATRFCLPVTPSVTPR